MIVLLRKGIPDEAVEAVRGSAHRMADHAPEVNHLGGTIVLRAPGVSAPEDVRALEAHEAVDRVIPSDVPFVLAARELRPEGTIVRVGDVEIGGPTVVVAAGPCSVEDEETLKRSAAAAREGGARLLRGGAFKPRTSCYAFQGLGEPGLRDAAPGRRLARHEGRHGGHVARARSSRRGLRRHAADRLAKRAELPAARGRRGAAEARAPEARHDVDDRRVPRRHRVRDRSRQRPGRPLRAGHPLVRSEDAEHLRRGRHPLLKRLSHLPVIADPSHGTGRADLVAPAARAAIAAGADGLLIEMHPEPARALSDGAQALVPGAFMDLAREVSALAGALGRNF